MWMTRQDFTDEDVQAHIQWLARDCTERTLYDRGRLLSRLADHAGAPMITLRAQQIEAWLATAPSQGTRHTYDGNARSFYRWAQLTERRRDDPMALLRRPKVPRRTPRPLTATAVQAARAVSTDHVETMVLLGFYAGLRACEIAVMRGDLIDHATNTMSVVGKGGHERRLPVHTALLERAELYPSGWWFPSPLFGRDHVTPKSVSSALSRTMRRAGVQATGHQLRHSFGSNVYWQTRDLRLTQRLMGHAFSSTTEIYTLVRSTDMEAAVLGLPELA